MTRRDFMKYSGLVTSVALTGIGTNITPGTAHATRKPNVVFILGDDMGWMDLGCY